MRFIDRDFKIIAKIFLARQIEFLNASLTKNYNSTVFTETTRQRKPYLTPSVWELISETFVQYEQNH